MNVVVFTTVFPNAAQPVHGLFVEERVRHAADLEHVRVVAPVSWQVSRAAARGARQAPGLDVLRPVFYYVPGLFKSLDWLLLAASALPTMRRLDRSLRIDLIDAHFGYPDGVAAIALGRWLRRPVTVTLRGSELVMARYRPRRLAMRMALPHAAAVIAVSTELADLAVQLGVSEDRVHVIPNGVNPQVYSSGGRADARARLGLDPEAQWIVSVGHVTEVKRFEQTIAAVASLVPEFPRLNLAIVGDLPASAAGYQAALRKSAEDLGVADRVRFTGLVGRAEVAGWLNAADLFVLASEREGSPNALLEALACGCPVVTRRVGDVAALVTPDAGLIFERDAGPAEIARTIRAALNRAWDAGCVRQHAASRTWQSVAREVQAVWASAARTGEPTPASYA